MISANDGPGMAAVAAVQFFGMTRAIQSTNFIVQRSSGWENFWLNQSLSESYQ